MCSVYHIIQVPNQIKCSASSQQETETMTQPPAYTRAQVDNCAYMQWYPSLQSVCIKSAVIPLPPAFVQLLLADKVYADVDRVLATLTTAEGQEQQQQATALKHMQAEVKNAIDKLGGRVLPKLNWSCPRDASWMLGTMQCTSFEDVFLLLQSSDFVLHDLTEPYAGCEVDDVEVAESMPVQEDTSSAQLAMAATSSRYLVLKKWCSFYDSMHFRCFVVGHALVGVSQRHIQEHYAFLFDQQDRLCDLIYEFYYTHFCGRSSSKKARFFPDPDFSFDVYVDKNNRVYLLNINVFGAITDTLLFSWEELLEFRDEVRLQEATRRANGDDDDDEADEHQVIDFRIVEAKGALGPNPLSSYRAPTDLIDNLAGGAGFEAFMDQVKRDATAPDSSDESSEEEEDDDDDVLWGSDNDDYD